DSATVELLNALNDPATAQAVQLEREVVRLLDGDCHSPIAALATLTEKEAILHAAVAARDGRPPIIRAEARVDIQMARRVPFVAAEQLKAQGAAALLHGK